MMLEAIMASYNSGDLSPALYFDSEGTIAEFNPLSPFFSFNIGRNPVDGYYYLAVMGVGGAPANRETLIFKFDINTMSIIQQHNVTRPWSDGLNFYDTHLKASVNFDNEGHFYFVRERGTDSSTGRSDGHSTDFLIYKTAIAGDVSSLVLWKTLSGYYSYPKIWIQGGTIYVSGRGTRTGLDVTVNTMEKSTDGGTTWINYEFLDIPTLSPVKRAYMHTVHNFDGNELVMILNVRNQGSGTYESVSVMRSEDGIIWNNWDKTFSKDTSTSGPLTLTEIEANMLLWKEDPTVYAVNFEGGVVKNGDIKILISRSIPTGDIDDGNASQSYDLLRLFTFGSEWSYEDLSDILPNNGALLWAAERTLQYVAGLEDDFIYVIERENYPTCFLKEYSSANGFKSYSVRNVFEGDGNYLYGSHAFNITEKGKHLITLIDVQGSTGDLESSSNLIFINP